MQIVLPDDEYRAVQDAAERLGVPMARLVRDSLRRTLAEEAEADPRERIANVLRFARFSGPTGEIDQILDEVEQGRSLP